MREFYNNGEKPYYKKHEWRESDAGHGGRRLVRSLPKVVARIIINLVLAPLCAFYLLRRFGIGSESLPQVWLAWICLVLVLKGVVLNVTVTWDYWRRRFY